ncbi:lytic transglycosylase domain-containing protein [Raoultella terrigena]|uniref:lytic transglycosylase domain-containing protein n=1 Tax=Raoultella terrigena TaxID=577 RepID=UPI001F3B8E63|nr:lytic transglycosylase domain-containing protein [Raoultella terrigena]
MLSTTAFMAAAMQCAASIHPSTALDVARVESGFNPYAIAEIIPKATRSLGESNVISHQPASRDKAELIIRRLVAQGRRYSVGLMQITSSNFHHYSLTASDLLDPCTNLSVFERILSDCYQRGGSLERALSCYYSGNFRTGLQPEAAFSGTSYVQRMGYVSASPRYAVPGTRECKSTMSTPLEAIPADKSSPPRLIWPGTVIRGVPAKLRQGKIAIAQTSAPSVRRSLSLSPREKEEE